MDAAEYRGGRADREREDERGADRVARAAPQHAHGVAHIAQGIIEPARAARVTMFFLIPHRAAEREQRLPPRLVARKVLLAHEILGLELDMRAHLLGHLPIDRAPEEERAQCPREGTHQTALRICSTAAENSFHSARSAASCFRPFGVRV